VLLLGYDVGVRGTRKGSYVALKALKTKEEQHWTRDSVVFVTVFHR
jgi:hypothetical protein